MIRGPERFALHRPADLFVSVVGLVLSFPVLAVSLGAARISSGGSGVFRQVRIGRNGAPFKIFKFRTMSVSSSGTTVTTANDSRITPVGRLLRATKVDEIPQLVNVLRGEMALLGPRPDVPGFADELVGDDRVLLELRPGITGPASVMFADEENLLSEVADPVTFNQERLYPLKVRINRAWMESGSLADDIRLLLWTVKRPSDDEVVSLLMSWGVDVVNEMPELGRVTI